MENKVLKTILSLIVIVMCAYFIFISAWFRVSPCPEGTRLVETVWVDLVQEWKCVQGEE